MQNIRIASPCSADWNKMSGSDRVRYCPECKLTVYNFSEMTPAETRAIVSAQTGRVCARFYQRADGTMLTKNCPVGFRGVLLRTTRMASATFATLLAVAYGKPAHAQTPSSPSLVQIQSVKRGPVFVVLDVTGAAISGATVSLTDDATAKYTEWKTAEDGHVRLTNLGSGPHSFTISAPGFESRTLQLKSPASETITVHLEVAALMGEFVLIPMVEPDLAPTPSSLTEPANADFTRSSNPERPSMPSQQKPAERRNAWQRFMSKLRNIF